jgi:hypothetical protein
MASGQPSVAESIRRISDAGAPAGVWSARAFYFGAPAVVGTVALCFGFFHDFRDGTIDYDEALMWGAGGVSLLALATGVSLFMINRAEKNVTKVTNEELERHGLN